MMHKEIILNMALGQFDNIPKLSELYELNPPMGWLEVHVGDSSHYTLHELIVSALRHVGCFEYEPDWQLEFEEDISLGLFIEMNREEALNKLREVGIVSLKLSDLKDDLIPRNLEELRDYDQFILVHHDWNQCCVVLASASQFKLVHVGHSE